MNDALPFLKPLFKSAQEWLTKEENLLDSAIIAALFFFSFLIWWPTRYLPYFWDSAGFVIPAAQKLLETNFMPLIPEFSEFAHPPLFPAYLAAIWKFFGINRLATHIAYAPFLPLFLVSTYLFSKQLLKDRRLSMVATFLTGFAPVVLAETGIVYLELPTAAFTLLALYLFLKKNRLGFAIAFSLAVLTKFTAFLALPFIIYHLFFNPEYKDSLKDWLPYAVAPLFLVVVWLAYHYSQTGWLLTRPGRPNLLFAPLGVKLQLLVLTLKRSFISQGKWLMSVVALLSGLYLFQYKKLSALTSSRSFMSILVGFTSAVLLFALMGEFTLRYGIFLIPFYAILAVWITFTALKDYKPDLSFKATAVLVGTVSLFWIYQWHPPIEQTSEYEFEPPNDLSYKDMITIGREAATFLSIQHPTAKIYGAFPENYQLTQPIQGYVFKPLDFDSCNNFKKDTKVVQIVYLHPYSPGQVQCQKLLQQETLVPYQRFESNGKWLELYQVEASESADLKEDAAKEDGLPL